MLSNNFSVHTPCPQSYSASLCHLRASILRSCVPTGLLTAPSPDLQLLFLLAAAAWDGLAAAGEASQAGAWGDTSLVMSPL